MAGKIKNFLDRDGRYFSRISVPKELRPYLGDKTALRRALGGDRRGAIAQHMIEVAVLQMKLDDAKRQYKDAMKKSRAGYSLEHSRNSHGQLPRAAHI